MLRHSVPMLHAVVFCRLAIAGVTEQERLGGCEKNFSID
jgi:hypothetical protein